MSFFLLFSILCHYSLHYDVKMKRKKPNLTFFNSHLESQWFTMYVLIIYNIVYIFVCIWHCKWTVLVSMEVFFIYEWPATNMCRTLFYLNLHIGPIVIRLNNIFVTKIQFSILHFYFYLYYVQWIHF